MNASALPNFVACSETTGILIWVEDRLLAKFLSLGLFDSYHGSVTVERAKTLDIVRHNYQYRRARIASMSDIDITPEFRERRRLLQARIDGMKKVMRFAKRQMVRAEAHFSDKIDGFLEYGVRLSAPAANDWHPFVVEYATALGLAPEIAYAEMRMRYENAGIIAIRNDAYLQKAVRLVNEAQTRKEAMALAKRSIEQARARL